MLDSALEQEEWTPVYATKRISASLIDLFQCLSQTAHFYLDSLSQPWPGVHPSAGARRTLDDLLAEMIGAVFAYVGRVKATLTLTLTPTATATPTPALTPTLTLRRSAATRRS